MKEIDRIYNRVTQIIFGIATGVAIGFGEFQTGALFGIVYAVMELVEQRYKDSTKTTGDN